jgi:Putative peptidoglycan binding domain
MSIQSPPVVSLRAPKDVSVTEIENELNQIWKDYQPENQKEDAIVATQATTFTLIVYEPEPTQHMLAVLGFYDGPIDGIFGPAQAKAIKAAQEAYKLPITGKLDPTTMSQIQTNYHDRIVAMSLPMRSPIPIPAELLHFVRSLAKIVVSARKYQYIAR